MRAILAISALALVPFAVGQSLSQASTDAFTAGMRTVGKARKLAKVRGTQVRENEDIMGGFDNHDAVALKEKGRIAKAKPGEPPLDSPVPGQQPEAPLGVPEKSVAPSWRLVGLVTGKGPNYAIVELGTGGESFLVRVGQPIVEGVVVKSITRDGLKVKKSGKTLSYQPW